MKKTSYYFVKIIGFAVVVSTILGGLGAVITYISTVPHATVFDGRVSDNTVQLVIKNSGTTTAYETTLTDSCIYAGDYPPKAGAILIQPNTPINLAPGQEFVYKKHVIPPPSKADLQQKRKAIYAFGVISYKDWIGIKRSEPFSLIYGGPYDVNTPDMGIWNSSLKKLR